MRRLDPTVGENEVGSLGEVGRRNMIAGCDAVCGEGIELGRPSCKSPRPPGAGRITSGRLADVIIVSARETVELPNDPPDVAVVRKSGVLLNGGAELALGKSGQLGPALVEAPEAGGDEERARPAAVLVKLPAQAGDLNTARRRVFNNEGNVVRDAQLKDLEDTRTFGVGPSLLADMSRGQLALRNPVRVLEGEEWRRQVTPGVAAVPPGYGVVGALGGGDEGDHIPGGNGAEDLGLKEFVEEDVVPRVLRVVKAGTGDAVVGEVRGDAIRSIIWTREEVDDKLDTPGGRSTARRKSGAPGPLTRRASEEAPVNVLGRLRRQRVGKLVDSDIAGHNNRLLLEEVDSIAAEDGGV